MSATLDTPVPTSESQRTALLMFHLSRWATLVVQNRRGGGAGCFSPAVTATPGGERIATAGGGFVVAGVPVGAEWSDGQPTEAHQRAALLLGSGPPDLVAPGENLRAYATAPGDEVSVPGGPCRRGVVLGIPLNLLILAELLSTFPAEPSYRLGTVRCRDHDALLIHGGGWRAVIAAMRVDYPQARDAFAAAPHWPSA
jgi:hypothetical protein